MKVERSTGVETAHTETYLRHLPDLGTQRPRFFADQQVVFPLGTRLRTLLQHTLSHQQASDQVLASGDVLRLHQLQQRVHADISAAQTSLRLLQAQRERFVVMNPLSQTQDSASTYLASQIHQLVSHVSPVGFNQTSMLHPNQLVVTPTSPNVASFTSAQPMARATNQMGSYAKPVNSIAADAADSQESIKKTTKDNNTIPRGTGAASVDRNDTPGLGLTKRRRREVSNSEIDPSQFLFQQILARDNDGVDDGSKNKGSFRTYQEEQWENFFIELQTYRVHTGNCFVPQTYKPNQPLARWVKRQRYQYKLMIDGKPSHMSEARVKALEDIGFVWCSHDATWVERLDELKEFRRVSIHCNVPTNYFPNPSLASWVKHQRRQYKFRIEGKSSNMTARRISDLEDIGFEWALRRGRSPVPMPSSRLQKTPFSEH
jgi:hypothetical protein